MKQKILIFLTTLMIIISSFYAYNYYSLKKTYSSIIQESIISDIYFLSKTIENVLDRSDPFDEDSRSYFLAVQRDLLKISSICDERMQHFNFKYWDSKESSVIGSIEYTYDILCSFIQRVIAFLNTEKPFYYYNNSVLFENWHDITLELEKYLELLQNVNFLNETTILLSSSTVDKHWKDLIENWNFKEAKDLWTQRNGRSED
ncbi:hypothetical protein RBH29_07220 [Herbivorax sp. ANBcel31]|uniref:hypothetical protein n=1 Tax=Herbivorax sp. ANBcel31 TaxID=3069754 RepID=UPI0027B25F34|nr:hypothetical protein [Herbivorax sp. ANBcel31]MDQ2086218.1 hypothetical protein [Herbivorax sp. ANBcel31]